MKIYTIMVFKALSTSGIKILLGFITIDLETNTK